MATQMGPPIDILAIVIYFVTIRLHRLSQRPYSIILIIDYHSLALLVKYIFEVGVHWLLTSMRLVTALTPAHCRITISFSNCS